MTEQQNQPAANIDVCSSRQTYEAPKLKSLGDVRELTLGGSPGTGDSGSPALQQF